MCLKTSVEKECKNYILIMVGDGEGKSDGKTEIEIDDSVNEPRQRAGRYKQMRIA